MNCYTAMNEHDEAQFVSAQILSGYSAGRKWKDHAILYRMNAQSNQIENAFKRNGIPYRIIGASASSTGPRSRICWPTSAW